MTNENVELVRRSAVLAAGGHWDAAMNLFAPDIEWVVAREHPETRTLVGPEAVAEYRRAWQATVPDMRLELDRVVDCDDAVVGIGAVVGTGRGSGAEVRVPLAIVYHFRHGLIARAEEYLDPAVALDAVGLQE
jgi:ketosteroid isomerase-like protein